MALQLHSPYFAQILLDFLITVCESCHGGHTTVFRDPVWTGSVTPLQHQMIRSLSSVSVIKVFTKHITYSCSHLSVAIPGVTMGTYGEKVRDLLLLSPILGPGQENWTAFALPEARYTGICNIATILKMKDPYDRDPYSPV